MIAAKATSFATFKDLVAMIDCLVKGNSERKCLANVVVGWNDKLTATDVLILRTIYP